MENEEAPSLYTHAIKFGLILGAITIALTAVIYAVDFSIFATLKFLGLIMVTTIGFIIYAGINYRNAGEGYLGYGKAFIYSFVLCAAAGLVGTIFNILLYHVIDPELPQKLADAIISNTEELMRSFGSNEDAIEKAIDGMRAQGMEKQFSMGSLAFGYVKAMIWYAIISAITALVIKKNPPELI